MSKLQKFIDRVKAAQTWARGFETRFAFDIHYRMPAKFAKLLGSQLLVAGLCYLTASFLAALSGSFLLAAALTGSAAAVGYLGIMLRDLARTKALLGELDYDLHGKN